MVAIAELPGVEAEALRVTGQGRTLTISGERRRGDSADSMGSHRREGPHREFSARFNCPKTWIWPTPVPRFGWRADGPGYPKPNRQAMANQRTQSLREGYAMIPEQEIVTKKNSRSKGLRRPVPDATSCRMF